jgi:hypothetical protein
MDSDFNKTRYEETQVLIKEDVDNAKNLKLPTIENQL